MCFVPNSVPTRWGTPIHIHTSHFTLCTDIITSSIPADPKNGYSNIWGSPLGPHKYRITRTHTHSPHYVHPAAWWLVDNLAPSTYFHTFPTSSLLALGAQWSSFTRALSRPRKQITQHNLSSPSPNHLITLNLWLFANILMAHTLGKQCCSVFFFLSLKWTEVLLWQKSPSIMQIGMRPSGGLQPSPAVVIKWTYQSGWSAPINVCVAS